MKKIILCLSILAVFLSLAPAASENETVMYPFVIGMLKAEQNYRSLSKGGTYHGFDQLLANARLSKSFKLQENHYYAVYLDFPTDHEGRCYSPLMGDYYGNNFGYTATPEIDAEIAGRKTNLLATVFCLVTRTSKVDPSPKIVSYDVIVHPENVNPALFAYMRNQIISEIIPEQFSKLDDAKLAEALKNAEKQWEGIK